MRGKVKISGLVLGIFATLLFVFASYNTLYVNAEEIEIDFTIKVLDENGLTIEQGTLVIWNVLDPDDDATISPCLDGSFLIHFNGIEWFDPDMEVGFEFGHINYHGIAFQKVIRPGLNGVSEDYCTHSTTATDVTIHQTTKNLWEGKDGIAIGDVSDEGGWTPQTGPYIDCSQMKTGDLSNGLSYPALQQIGQETIYGNIKIVSPWVAHFGNYYMTEGRYYKWSIKYTLKVEDYTGNEINNGCDEVTKNWERYYPTGGPKPDDLHVDPPLEIEFSHLDALPNSLLGNGKYYQYNLIMEIEHKVMYKDDGGSWSSLLDHSPSQVSTPFDIYYGPFEV